MVANGADVGIGGAAVSKGAVVGNEGGLAVPKPERETEGTNPLPALLPVDDATLVEEVVDPAFVVDCAGGVVADLK